MSREDNDNRGQYRGREPERSSREWERGRGREPERGRGRDAAPSREEPRSGRDRGSDRGSSRGRDSERAAGFSYKGRDRDAVEKRATMGNREFDRYLKDGIKVFQPRKGDNRIRFLPPTWKSEDGKQPHYGYDIHVHYGVGADRATYLCLTSMKDQDDPIYEEWQEMKRSGAHKDDVRQVEAKRRILVYLIDRDDEQAGIQAWAMPMGVDQDISKISVDRSSGEVLNIDDPDEGYDVEFYKEGDGLTTKYSGFVIARRPSPLGRNEWLNFAIANPLPDQLIFYTYEEIAKVFGGGGAPAERDRADDRSSRDDTRGRDREQDAPRDRDRGESSRAAPALTYEAVHGMTGKELDILVEEQNLNIDPTKAESDAVLADWICEDMGLKREPEPAPAEAPRTRRSAREEPVNEAPQRSKLDEMRARR